MLPQEHRRDEKSLANFSRLSKRSFRGWNHHAGDRFVRPNSSGSCVYFHAVHRGPRGLCDFRHDANAGPRNPTPRRAFSHRDPCLGAHELQQTRCGSSRQRYDFRAFSAGTSTFRHDAGFASRPLRRRDHSGIFCKIIIVLSDEPATRSGGFHHRDCIFVEFIGKGQFAEDSDIRGTIQPRFAHGISSSDCIHGSSEHYRAFCGKRNYIRHWVKPSPGESNCRQTRSSPRVHRAKSWRRRSRIIHYAYPL